VKKIIKKGLSEATTEDDQTLYIQFVRNSAVPEFIPQLLDFAENSKFPLVNHLAITSMGVYDTGLLDDNVGRGWERAIFRVVVKNGFRIELVRFWPCCAPTSTV